MPEPSPHAAADRNLLFGILALQADLISRDALISAMNAWAVHKDKGLGQLLREQGALDADQHAAVEGLVSWSLDRHQGDAGKSLAALGSLGSARQELEQIADADLQASLSQVTVDRPAERGEPTEDATTVGRPTSAGLRFRILRPHAKGGLGEVFVARDGELHREVALKEIQQHYADQPDSRSRFLLEAEITGGLEHPGIVPVYGLGTYADGRPFYAMRFIRGDSLKDAIARFHQADVPGRDPGERTLTLRGLLRRFIDVCNAIAYAHARGVLHRDLKPGNVMLGRYGETLVVDWGLAKAVGRPEGAASTEEGTLRPTSASDSAPTQMGSAIGTPAYMSPEQAAGRPDLLGPASDVYSLGATLYHLLTGRPPFAREDVGAMLQKVQRGELVPPRQVKGSVPPALEAICLKAMALAPGQRYGSPQALADDLEHWLADEPVRAYREPLLARLGRWRRRHRALVAGVTAAALALLVMGGIGVFWLVEQAAELRRGVAAALDKARGLQQQARWGEAEAVLDQTQDRLGESGPGDLRQRVRQARADLSLVRRLDAARLKAATMVVGGKFDFVGAERAYAAAFRQAQLGRPGDKVAAVAARIRGSAVKEQLVAALDDWAGISTDWRQFEWLLAVARRADPGRWRDQVRDPAVWTNRAALQRLVRQAPVERLSPHLVGALARVLMIWRADAVPLLTAALERHPQDFWLNFAMGNALQERQQVGEAVGYYRAARALRPKIGAVYINLGNSLSDKGEVDRAIACWQKALAIDPGLAPAHANLGNALYAQGQRDRAMACWQKALALDPKLAHAHYSLGIALKAKGELDGAIACYQKALALEPRFAEAHNNLGLALYAKGRLDGAIACFHKALALDPKNTKAHTNLGIALHDKGQLDRAIACYAKALALDPKDAKTCYILGVALEAKGELDRAIIWYKKVLVLEPKNTLAHANLGNVLYARGDLDGAIACFAKALAIDPKLAQVHTNLGVALHAKGERDRAIACFEKALALDPKHAKALYNLGIALKDKGELDRAIACYDKALAINPRDAKIHNNLGLVLQANGDLDGALACYEKALALDPKHAQAHYNLGNALRDKGRFNEAMTAYRQAIALKPNFAEPHCNLGLALLRKGEIAAAVAALKRGHQLGGQQPHWPYPSAQWLKEAEHLLQLDHKLPALLKGLIQPASAAECIDYGYLCQCKQFYVASARLFAAAFSADPKPVLRRQAACAAALAAAGQGRDAGQLTAQERARLRRQALAWLRGDLALWTHALASGQAQVRVAVLEQLGHWQRDADLAGIRDAAWIVNLPDSELRACRQLWADVAALLKRAGSPK
jgi:tetratricopeptide (TPR) repeat protein/serine/threonine protein kinase